MVSRIKLKWHPPGLLMYMPQPAGEQTVKYRNRIAVVR
jgi:hypothetical protein